MPHVHSELIEVIAQRELRSLAKGQVIKSDLANRPQNRVIQCGFNPGLNHPAVRLRGLKLSMFVEIYSYLFQLFEQTLKHDYV